MSPFPRLTPVRWILIPALFASALSAQAPKIGAIDFYGLRKVPEAKIRQALDLKAGDDLPKSKGDVEDRIDQVPGVVETQLSAVCCEDGKATLYVGISERDAPHFEIREDPTGDVRLPNEVLDAYRQFLVTVNEAAQKGMAEDNIAQGHSLMSYGPARVWQNLFLEFAKQYSKQLHAVLRDSSDEEHRAAAACVLAYYPRKFDVVDDLQYAMKDPDPAVRNNAMRALTAIAALHQRDPELAPKISPTWFIEMLNSVVWTDRNKASLALLDLTDSRDENTLSYLRERSLPSLVEMARWKSLGHAFAPFVLLGRAAGIPEKEIRDAWTAGEREKMIADITAEKKKRK
ncbi:MAG: HEAT repeat domain-containing protein [Bryobacteraceae bacterium]